MNGFRLGVVAAALVAGTVAAGCPTPTCRVRVVVSVTDDDGNPVSDATVTDVGQCVPGYVECVRDTGADGRTAFSGTDVTSGEGQIRVEKPGFVTVTEPYTFSCGGSSATIDVPVTLRR